MLSILALKKSVFFILESCFSKMTFIELAWCTLTVLSILRWVKKIRLMPAPWHTFGKKEKVLVFKWFKTPRKQHTNKNELNDTNPIQCWMTRIKEYVIPLIILTLGTFSVCLNRCNSYMLTGKEKRVSLSS